MRVLYNGFVAEMASPSSSWKWWGVKCDVRGGLKTVAGSNFTLIFYLCAECRRIAWYHAREASDTIPEGVWTEETADGIFETSCHSMAKIAVYKAFKVRPEEVTIYEVWVDED